MPRRRACSLGCRFAVVFLSATGAVVDDESSHPSPLVRQWVLPLHDKRNAR